MFEGEQMKQETDNDRSRSLVLLDALRWPRARIEQVKLWLQFSMRYPGAGKRGIKSLRGLTLQQLVHATQTRPVTGTHLSGSLL